MDGVESNYRGRFRLRLGKPGVVAVDRLVDDGTRDTYEPAYVFRNDEVRALVLVLDHFRRHLVSLQQTRDQIAVLEERLRNYDMAREVAELGERLGDLKEDLRACESYDALALHCVVCVDPPEGGA